MKKMFTKEAIESIIKKYGNEFPSGYFSKDSDKLIYIYSENHDSEEEHVILHPLNGVLEIETITYVFDTEKDEYIEEIDYKSSIYIPYEDITSIEVR